MPASSAASQEAPAGLLVPTVEIMRSTAARWRLPPAEFSPCWPRSRFSGAVVGASAAPLAGGLGLVGGA
eukprot:1636196-Pyramimonas_sp.AAC.1